MLAACSQADILNKVATPEDQAVARAYVDQLRSKQFDDIVKAADPSISSPTLRDTLVTVSALIPAGEPTSVTLVGAHRMMSSEGTETLNLTFEYAYEKKWMLSNVAIKKQGDSKTIVGLNVQIQDSSLAQQSAFSLQGKTALQYLLLALVVVLPLFTLFALVLCVRTRLRGRKWPWVLFILVGFGKCMVNWNSGEWAFAPASLQLLSASATASINSPWVLAVSFPLGAVVFLLLRDKLKVRPAGNDDQGAVPS
jgi:hypothetical protein